jgi:hypothetical protein
MNHNEINLLKNELHLLKIRRQELLEALIRDNKLQERIDKISIEIESIQTKLDNQTN